MELRTEHGGIDADADDRYPWDIRETCRFFGGESSPLNPATLYRGIKPASIRSPSNKAQARRAGCLASANLRGARSLPNATSPRPHNGCSK